MCLPSVCRDCKHRFHCDHRPDYVPPIGAGGPSPIGTGSSTEYDSHAAQRAAMWRAAETEQMRRSLQNDDNDW